MAAYHEVLGANLSAKQRAVLGLGLSFFTWRTLRDGGLDTPAAVEAMVQAIDGVEWDLNRNAMIEGNVRTEVD
jgi:hypothetical protein